MLAHVGESRRTLGAILEVAQPLGCDGETLYVAVTSDFQRLQLESRDHVRFVEGALADLGLPARRFRCVARPGQAAGASPAAARPAAAPLRDSARPNVAAADAPLPAAAPRPAAAVPSADPAAPPVDLVEKVIEMFGGEVVG
ncbi:MAG: hypothetical protein HZB25_04620 [Candidatus Eisenbacteria bacterium]|nr:hypothetical protein [Candidatus Eisenbacteria bacterium]